MAPRKRSIYVFEDDKGGIYSVTNDEFRRAILHLEQMCVKRKANGSVRTRKSKRGVEDTKEDKVKEKKTVCTVGRCAEGMETEIMLNCRQLLSVANELRKLILLHDWNLAVYLTTLLCQPCCTRYTLIIIRICLLLLLNHPKSNREIMEKFIKSCTSYKSRKYVTKFLKSIFCIRKTTLQRCGVGQYLRKSAYKLIDEQFFKDL